MTQPEVEAQALFCLSQNEMFDDLECQWGPPVQGIVFELSTLAALFEVCKLCAMTGGPMMDSRPALFVRIS